MIVQNLNFDQTVALAKAKAEKMIENGLYSRFRLSDKERLDKALLGCIGELAFQQHLSNLGIPFELDHTDFQSHHTDEFDVKVNDAKIDIKVKKKTMQKKIKKGKKKQPPILHPTTGPMVIHRNSTPKQKITSL